MVWWCNFYNSGAIAIIEDSTFIGNRGFAGGTLFIFKSYCITLINTLISESIASSGSVYAIGHTTIWFESNVTIARNIGTVQLLSGATLYLLENTIFEKNTVSNLTKQLQN